MYTMKNLQNFTLNVDANSYDTKKVHDIHKLPSSVS